MTSLVAILRTIVAILPILRELINAAEAFFPEKGSGYQKLELVKGLISAAYETVGKLETPFATVWPVLEKLVAFLVPIFTKKSEPEIDTTAQQVSTLAKTQTVDLHSAVFKTPSPGDGVQLASSNS